MPNQTKNLRFNVFLENEPVDFEQINANFEKIDSLLNCVEHGTKSTNYSGGATGTANWTYRKYSDGSIELYTVVDVSTMKCNIGDEMPFSSSAVDVPLPFKVNVKSLLTHLSTSVMNIVTDETNSAAKNNLVFTLKGFANETATLSKRLFIHVKGDVAIG